MTDRSRSAYASLASLFLAIGTAGVVLGIVDAAFDLDLFRGNPAPTSLFVVAIGVALRWTARSAAPAPASDDGEADADGDAADSMPGADEGTAGTDDHHSPSR